MFIISAVTPIVFGYNVGISIEKEIQLTESSKGEDVDWWSMFCHDAANTGYSN